MKHGKSLRVFAHKVMGVVNRIRLLGEDQADQRVVEEDLVSPPVKFEHKIASLKDSKDLIAMSIGELVCTFQVVAKDKTCKEMISSLHRNKLKLHWFS